MPITLRGGIFHGNMATSRCVRCYAQDETEYDLCRDCRRTIEAEEAYRKVLAARELVAASERMKGKRDDA